MKRRATASEVGCGWTDTNEWKNVAGRLDENERLDASGLDALFFVGFDPGASRLPSSPHPSESLCFVQPHYDRPPERQSDSGQRIEVLTTTELRPQTHEALTQKRNRMYVLQSTALPLS